MQGPVDCLDQIYNAAERSRQGARTRVTFPALRARRARQEELEPGEHERLGDLRRATQLRRRPSPVEADPPVRGLAGRREEEAELIGRATSSSHTAEASASSANPCAAALAWIV